MVSGGKVALACSWGASAAQGQGWLWARCTGGVTETRSQKRLRLSEEAVLKESDPERWELTIANTDANSRKRKRD